MNLYLLLACIAILIGPILFQSLKRFSFAHRVIDGFVFVSIGGLLIGHLLEGIGADNGLTVFLFLILGFFGPLVLENTFKKVRGEVHFLTLVAGGIGFLIHALFDGAALVSHTTGSEGLLGLAVIIHRIPVGLTLWWLLQPKYGNIVASVALLLSIVATILGFVFTNSILLHSLSYTFPWIQAFVAGSILHVVFFRFHLYDTDEEHEGHHGHDCAMHAQVLEEKELELPSMFSAEGVGNLLGIALLIGFAFLSDHNHHGEPHLSEVGNSIVTLFVDLAFESAPALFIAYIMGIFIYGFFPEGSIGWLRRGGVMQQSFRGMIVGLPLPVCSCGVLPYYQTLVKKGAPPAAALAFLIATPELGLDALILSFPLLGVELTWIRVVACVVIAIVVSAIVSFKMKSHPVEEQSEIEEEKGLREKFKRGANFALVELVDSTAPWMVVGLVLAACTGVFLQDYSLGVSPLLEVVLFSCIGLVVYVCASGATPLVAALIASGVSPGAGLAFLITGPATNVSTFGILSQLHGRGVAIRFGALMMLSGIALGMITNIFFADIEIGWSVNAHHHGVNDLSLFSWIALISVGLLFLSSFVRLGGRSFFSHVWK